MHHVAIQVFYPPERPRSHLKGIHKSVFRSVVNSSHVHYKSVET